MKKIIMTIAAAFVATAMNAQVYVGGSIGLNAWSSQKNAGDRSETTFKILPEIGYNINDSWAIGTVIGYESDKWQGRSGGAVVCGRPCSTRRRRGRGCRPRGL